MPWCQCAQVDELRHDHLAHVCSRFMNSMSTSFSRYLALDKEQKHVAEVAAAATAATY